MQGNSWMYLHKARKKETTSHYAPETALRMTEWMKNLFQCIQTAVSLQLCVSVLYIPTLIRHSSIKNSLCFSVTEKKNTRTKRKPRGWHEVKGNISRASCDSPINEPINAWSLITDRQSPLALPLSWVGDTLLFPWQPVFSSLPAREYPAAIHLTALY